MDEADGHGVEPVDSTFAAARTSGPPAYPAGRLAGPNRRAALLALVEPERSQTNEPVPTSVYRPFCDDNVLVLVALTS
jgi:hypothetical protein